MPELESNLLILVGVLGAVMALGLIARSLWRPVLRRVWLYFVLWWERDARLENEARVMKKARQRAESEVRDCLGGTETTETSSVESVLPQSEIPMDGEPVKLDAPKTYLQRNGASRN